MYCVHPLRLVDHEDQRLQNLDSASSLTGQRLVVIPIDVIAAAGAGGPWMMIVRSTR